jgi:quercetin dioxygenase-like cupin family protein
MDAIVATKPPRVVIAASLAACLGGCCHGAASPAAAPEPRVVQLAAGSAYQPIVEGPPLAVGMHSGRVVVLPGQGAETHSTEGYEEILVVVQGEGELRIEGGPSLPLAAGTAAYVPPATRHHTVCTGGTPLRYVYVAAPAR